MTRMVPLMLYMGYMVLVYITAELRVFGKAWTVVWESVGLIDSMRVLVLFYVLGHITSLFELTTISGANLWLGVLMRGRLLTDLGCLVGCNGGVGRKVFGARRMMVAVVRRKMVVVVLAVKGTAVQGSNVVGTVVRVWEGSGVGGLGDLV